MSVPSAQIPSGTFTADIPSSPPPTEKARLQFRPSPPGRPTAGCTNLRAEQKSALRAEQKFRFPKDRCFERRTGHERTQLAWESTVFKESTHFA